MAHLKAAGQYEAFKKHKSAEGMRRYHAMPAEREEANARTWFCKRSEGREWSGRERARNINDAWMHDGANNWRRKNEPWEHEEPHAVIFLYGIWRHTKEFGIEEQIPRIPSPVKPERRCLKTSGS